MGCQTLPLKSSSQATEEVFISRLPCADPERGQGSERQADLLMLLGFGDEEGKSHKPLMGALKKTQGPVKNKETALGIGAEADPREAQWGRGGGVARGGQMQSPPPPPPGWEELELCLVIELKRNQHCGRGSKETM